jgi:hypothetical protein
LPKNPLGSGIHPRFGKIKGGKQIMNNRNRRFPVIEPLLSGIVLGLIPVTLAGLFYAAYKQYKRPNELGG